MSMSQLPSNPAQTLLVPLDGSPAAESILPAAILLARRLPATMTLLHTVERDAPDQVHGERHIRGKEEAGAYLAPLAERLTADGLQVDWHVHVVPVGDVPLSIASHASAQNAALILLSTHATRDPRSWLIGAVAQGVIRHAAPPVLLQRTDSKRGSAPFAPAEVTVAIDPERQGEAAIPAARRLARALDIPLRLLSVAPTVDTVPGDRSVAARLLPSGAAAALDLEAEAASQHLATLAARLQSDEPDLTIVAEVARGDPARIMTRIAQDHQGILALATHGRAGLDALWSGSIGSRVIGRGEGPFLLVHPEPANADVID